MLRKGHDGLYKAPTKDGRRKRNTVQDSMMAQEKVIVASDLEWGLSVWGIKSLLNCDSCSFISRGAVRCQDSSVERFLRIDPMISGSSPTSAKLSLRVRRVASSLQFQA